MINWSDLRQEIIFAVVIWGLSYIGRIVLSTIRKPSANSKEEGAARSYYPKRVLRKEFYISFGVGLFFAMATSVNNEWVSMFCLVVSIISFVLTIFAFEVSLEQMAPPPINGNFGKDNAEKSTDKACEHK